jgi:hypothetical protein
MRPVGQSIDRLQRAEEIGLRDHQRGKLIGRLQRRLPPARRSVTPLAGSNGTLTSSMF